MLKEFGSKILLLKSDVGHKKVLRYDFLISVFSLHHCKNLPLPFNRLLFKLSFPI